MGKETQPNLQKKTLENIFVSSEQRFLKQDAKSTNHWEETDKWDFIKMKEFVQQKSENSSHPGSWYLQYIYLTKDGYPEYITSSWKLQVSS